MPQRKYYRKIYQKNKKRRAFLIFKIIGIALSVFLFLALFLFVYYSKDLPLPEKFTERQLVQSTKIYDRSGEVLLYEIYGEEKRTWVPLEKISEDLQAAVLVAEDSNFYYHFGIDPKGIARSMLINLKIMKPTYGGSTIPQQLIRSTFLSPEKTIERKIREIILALELDHRYSKKQILEWYLNQVPFGQNTYGVEAASQTYFNKSALEVSPAEAAILAALIQAPSRLSPYGKNKDDLLSRKNYILDRMVKKGYLSEEEGEKEKEKELSFTEVLQPIKAPHFTLWVKNYLETKYGEDFLREKGLQIYTSLDWELQSWAEKVLEEGTKINKKYNANNSSLVSIDPKTGQILVMVGSADWYSPDSYPKDCESSEGNCLFDPKFNVATLGLRQPGSAFKPFVYITAFKKGFNSEDKVVDEETNFGIWGDKEYIPQNYDKEFHGEITLREALAQSINIASVKVLRDFAGLGDINVGLNDSVETAKDLGITTLISPYYPSMVLGGYEIKLLEMVSAYGVFATEGLRVEPVAILKIEDSDGNIIEENKKTQKRVIEKEPTRIINDILSDNQARIPMFGSNSPLYFPGYQVAAKTGTTQNWQDAWTIGYSPSIVTGIWVGNNNCSPMAKKSGVMLSSPMWHQFMEKALLKFPKESFEKPSLIESTTPEEDVINLP